MGKTNRILFAWWRTGWQSEGGDRAELTNQGEKIPPSEYEGHMENSIFCPVCFTPLFRSPKDKPLFSNERSARYNHYSSFSHVECRLRAARTEGLKFDSEELATQAIADGTLTVVHSFRADGPDAAAGTGGLNVAYFEDLAGPVANCPISRHKGQSFELPTTISTVGAICRRFDNNLYKYYLLPGRSAAVLLASELIDIKTVEFADDTPRFYFGEIFQSSNAGKTKANLRMTRLRCHAKVPDFYLKAVDSEQTSKGINDDTRGRAVLFWGVIVANGIGLSVNRPKWGEYALLPTQYERLLPGAA